MKIKDLIEILHTQDPEIQVLIEEEFDNPSIPPIYWGIGFSTIGVRYEDSFVADSYVQSLRGSKALVLYKVWPSEEEIHKASYIKKHSPN